MQVVIEQNINVDRTIVIGGLRLVVSCVPPVASVLRPSGGLRFSFCGVGFCLAQLAFDALGGFQKLMGGEMSADEDGGIYELVFRFKAPGV